MIQDVCHIEHILSASLKEVFLSEDTAFNLRIRN
jgi:hypothetical protein